MTSSAVVRSLLPMIAIAVLAPGTAGIGAGMARTASTAGVSLHIPAGWQARTA